MGTGPNLEHPGLRLRVRLDGRKSFVLRAMAVSDTGAAV
jgi:hypothetical protein